MKRISVFSGYRQFYVTDLDANPEAPEDWTEDDIDNRFCARAEIVALAPENDITANINVHWLDDAPDLSGFDFIVETTIGMTGSKIGVIGWPDELCDSQTVKPGTYKITFTGHNIDNVASDEDYYTLWIH